MSATVIRLADRGRPFKPRIVESWFEVEYREAMVRAGLWDRGRAERPCDSEPACRVEARLGEDGEPAA